MQSVNELGQFMSLYPPVFIVGVPRSGTTLLRMMLDSHPSLAIPPETHFLLDLFASHRATEITRYTLLKTILSSPRWNDFCLSSQHLEDSLMNIHPFSIGAGITCFYHLYASRFDKPRWGDKTPQYSLLVNHLSREIPEIKFVHVVRDGRDVFLSLKSTWFGKNVSARQHAYYWRRNVVYTESVGIANKNLLQIRYEDLVADSTSTLRKICKFIHLNYAGDMMNYFTRSRHRLSELSHLRMQSGESISPGDRVAIHRSTMSPPTSGSIGRWRNEMSPPDLDSYMSIASDLLLKLGYDLV